MLMVNKNILITGATGGIGSILCKKLAKNNNRLIMTCVNSEGLTDLKKELGTKHTYIEADISSEKGRELITKACHSNASVESDDSDDSDGSIKSNESIDVLINLAGILDFKLFEEQSVELITNIININLLSPMLICHELIPVLKKKKAAIILNVGSIFGSIGHPCFAAYCSSKAGLQCFSESLSRELADTSIRVSYIAPRATSTSLNSNKLNRLNEKLGNKSDSPDYVSDEIIKLLSSRERQVYLGWPEKLFVKINAIFPKLVHKSLVKKLTLIKKYAQ